MRRGSREGGDLAAGWSELGQALPHPVLVLGADHEIVFANDRAAQLLGYERDSLQGQPLNVIIPERLHSVEGRAFVDALWLRQSTAGGVGVRAAALRGDGVEVYVEFLLGSAAVEDTELVVLCLRPLPESLDFGFPSLQGEPVGAAERETHRLVFDNAPLGIFHFDRDGSITACNDYFVRIIGSSKQVLVGLNMLTLPDKGIVRALRSALAGRRGYYEGNYHSVTGKKTTPVRVDFAPIRGSQEEVVGGVGIVEDITERREADLALRRSEAAFRTLIEAAPDAIAVYKDEGLSYVNPALVQALGYESADQLADLDMQSIVHPDDRESFRSNTEAMLRSWKPIPLREKRLLRRDGSVLTVEVATIPIHFDDEPGILFFARDITERKQMEAQLAQADRLASVGSLAAGVAHEINNPLAYVLGSLGLADRQLDVVALHGDDSSELDEALEILRQCVANSTEGAERMRVIVKDLMTFSRVEQEKRRPVDVERVIDSTLNIAWNEIRHRATVKKSYGGVPPVMGDEARLGQVFLNLLVNAAQSIPEGRASRSEIRLTTRAAGSKVVVEVEDTGAGIEPEHLKHIFDPFYTTKSDAQGTGLGLAICHGIVTSFGGEITAESQPGKGSRFKISLQAAPPEVSLDPPPKRQEPSASTAGRILLVDDEALLGKTLKIAFAGKHEIVTVTAGREAIELFETDRAFDLVLCDLMMPDVSGMEVYEHVKLRYPELAERFVFVTGGAFTEAAREFLERHPERQLEKPFDISQVEELVARLTGGEERSSRPPSRHGTG